VSIAVGTAVSIAAERAGEKRSREEQKVQRVSIAAERGAERAGDERSREEQNVRA